MDSLFTMGPQEKTGSEITTAIDDLFTALEDKDLLGPVEQAKKAILTKTSRALDVGLAQPKISVAVANLLTRTLDALDNLPEAVARQDSMDAWDLEALDATRAAMAAEAEADMLDTVEVPE